MADAELNFVTVARSFSRLLAGSPADDAMMDSSRVALQLLAYYGDFSAEQHLRIKDSPHLFTRGSGAWTDCLAELEAYAKAYHCEFWHVELVGKGVDVARAMSMLAIFAVRNLLLTSLAPHGVMPDGHEPIVVSTMIHEGIVDAAVVAFPAAPWTAVRDIRKRCRPDVWAKLLVAVLGLVAHQVQAWQTSHALRIWHAALTLDAVLTDIDADDEVPQVYVSYQEHLVITDLSSGNKRGWFQDRASIELDADGAAVLPYKDLEMRSVFASLEPTDWDVMPRASANALAELQALAATAPYGQPPMDSEEPARPPTVCAVYCPGLDPPVVVQRMAGLS
jgi:hypothetical protein